MDEIRKIAPEDVAQCVALVKQNWGSKVATRFNVEVHHAFNPTIAWPPVYFVSVQGNKVVGFAGMQASWIMHGVWDFIWINVDPAYQSAGIGTALTKKRLDFIRQSGGKVVHLMTKHPSFFNRFDFVSVYKNGEWFFMMLNLGKLKL